MRPIRSASHLLPLPRAMLFSAFTFCLLCLYLRFCYNASPAGHTCAFLRYVHADFILYMSRTDFGRYAPLPAPAAFCLPATIPFFSWWRWRLGGVRTAHPLSLADGLGIARRGGQKTSPASVISQCLFSGRTAIVAVAALEARRFYERADTPYHCRHRLTPFFPSVPVQHLSSPLTYGHFRCLARTLCRGAALPSHFMAAFPHPSPSSFMG